LLIQTIGNPSVMNFSSFWQLSIRGSIGAITKATRKHQQVGQTEAYGIGISRVFVGQLIRNELHSMPNSQNSKGGPDGIQDRFDLIIPPSKIVNISTGSVEPRTISDL
jgi:hypothetical protein